MKANSLYMRRDFAEAAAIYEQIAAADPTDGFAAFMLATCYEQEGRSSDALHWADAAADNLPGSFEPLRTAARLAIACDEHERASGYVLRALALPEVTTEMPRESLLPKPVMWLIWVLYHTPFLRRRLRPAALAELQPGYQTVELQKWKEWARGYLAWRSGSDGMPPQSQPH